MHTKFKTPAKAVITDADGKTILITTLYPRLNWVSGRHNHGRDVEYYEAHIALDYKKARRMKRLPTKNCLGHQVPSLAGFHIRIAGRYSGWIADSNAECRSYRVSFYKDQDLAAEVFKSRQEAERNAVWANF